MTRTCALIPARAGSKGVPDKNIRLLSGEPLLTWSVRAAVMASSVQRVIVSTDSAKYAGIAAASGAEVPFLRPDNASDDQAGDQDVVEHLVTWLREEGLPLPDFIVYLRPTTPLRNPATIDAGVQALIDNTEATSLRSIHEMAESAYKTFELVDGVLLSVGSGEKALDAASGPRQGFPATWIGNGYVDVFRTRRLMDGLPLFGDHVAGFETGVAPEIDIEADFDYLEYQAKRQIEIYNTLFNNNISEFKASS